MKKNNKGFTLAELLVVVAIIAVLVAISIPVFTSQLKKSELATDTANVRAAYAEAVTDALTNPTYNSDGDLQVTITDPSTKCTASVSGSTVTITHDSDSSLTNTFTIDSDVELTIN